MRYLKFGLVFGCLLLSACETNKSNASKQGNNVMQSSEVSDEKSAENDDISNLTDIQKSDSVNKNTSRKSDTNDFLDYENSRFGFSMIYPDSFTMEQESENEDGAAFTDKNGIKLLIYGCNNCNEDGKPYLNGRDYMNYLIQLNNKYIIDYYIDGKYCSYTYKNEDGDFVFSASKVNDDSIAGFCFIFTEQQKSDVKNYIRPMESNLKFNDVFL